MRNNPSLLILFLLLSVFTESFSQNFSPTDLQCEHLVMPLGVDNTHPRFTWRMMDSRQGARQTAYRIVVAEDSAAVTSGNASVWDSKWVTSGNNLIPYEGLVLKPFQRYYWGVAIADKDGKKSSLQISWFETGMMGSHLWKGAWISDANGEEVKPAPYFRKEFQIKKKVKMARAYVAVAGLYEFSVNGKPSGNHRLDPMYTRFDRRTLYVSHDVTSLLQPGNNALGILLGNGWYNHQSTAVWDFHKAGWRNRPAFCMDLRITYEDGTVETIISENDWKTALSPVIFNSIYTAEHYDARLEQEGWNKPGFDAASWKDVVYRQAPSTNIVSQMLYPVRDVESIPSREMKKLNDTTYVFDLGRNISGVSEIHVTGEAGTRLRLKHGERLYSNGHVDISNIDAHYRPTNQSDPFQTDILILNGKGETVFRPKFNYKGFQYVEVTSNHPVTLTKENLKGFFMHSDVPVAGTISSSNDVLNKVWWATNNSYLSNLFGYPTDCPQREKNGWTGDAQIAIETGLYGFDGITVYEKWMADHRDEQQPNGVLPAIIPTSGWGYQWANGPDWTSTIGIIPWNLYLFYGDSKALADCYEPLKRYVDHIDETWPTGLTTWGLGDWIPVKSKSPVELTSTCYYYTDAVILAKAALLFGRQEDHTRYTALAEKIRDAFNEKYLHRDTGIYGEGLQTELSAPLFWGLVPTEMKEKVAANLAKRVEADQFHLDVGLLGQKAILNALSENGYADVAYKIAAQETYPSWGWWIKNGATTLYENWDVHAANDISMNHIMFGEIGAWLYKGPGGIKPDPEHPGFGNVLLAPHFVPGLTSFEATHKGPHGEIKSTWTRKGKGIHYEVRIPPNSTATLTLPEVKGQKAYSGKQVLKESKLHLESGVHVFDWK